MTLHLGGNVVIPMKYIIAIIDLETSEISEINKEFFEAAKEEATIKNISIDKPKSAILAKESRGTTLFLSPISSATLFKRSRLTPDVYFHNSIEKQER
ncbi:MAG: DUF370 domain-containing protein [Clostridiales bacterium]|nr:DUF370 domain-containing protein [Clostridiales bacterium]